jgi:transcriptional regulator with XRE-family HTH domain
MNNEISLSLIAGINLKRLIRSSKYMTQENFAYEFGAEIRTVSRWLNAGVKNIDTLEEIADFLEVDVFELLKKKDDREKGE